MSDTPGLVDRVAGSPTSLVVSLIADVAAVIVLLANDNLLAWVARNPVLVIAAMAFLLAVTVTCVNALSRSRRVHRLLTSQLESVETEREHLIVAQNANAVRDRQHDAKAAAAFEQDRRKFAEFQSDFGKETRLEDWLSSAPANGMSHESYFRTLDKLNTKWLRDPIPYNNAEVEASFQELKAAVSKFSDVTVMHFFRIDDNSEYLRIETGINMADESYYAAAFREVEDSAEAVLGRWRSFMRISHKEQLD